MIPLKTQMTTLKEITNGDLFLFKILERSTEAYGDSSNPTLVISISNHPNTVIPIEEQIVSINKPNSAVWNTVNPEDGVVYTAEVREVTNKTSYCFLKPLGVHNPDKYTTSDATTDDTSSSLSNIRDLPAGKHTASIVHIGSFDLVKIDGEVYKIATPRNSPVIVPEVFLITVKHTEKRGFITYNESIRRLTAEEKDSIKAAKPVTPRGALLSQEQIDAVLGTTEEDLDTLTQPKFEDLPDNTYTPDSRLIEGSIWETLEDDKILVVKIENILSGKLVWVENIKSDESDEHYEGREYYTERDFLQTFYKRAEWYDDIPAQGYLCTRDGEIVVVMQNSLDKQEYTPISGEQALSMVYTDVYEEDEFPL